nr:hypothetical protein [uncultured Mediterranean phage uvMED]
MTDRIQKAGEDFLKVLNQEIKTRDFHLRFDDKSGSWFLCVAHIEERCGDLRPYRYYHELFKLRGGMTKEEAESYINEVLKDKARHIKNHILDLTGCGLTKFIA